MALAIEAMGVTEELGAWSLPEKLPGNSNVTLRAIGDFSNLNPNELTRVNFGVAELARVIFEGGGSEPGFGYRIEPRIRNVYAVIHEGLESQASVEGLVIRRGVIYNPEFVLFQARRI
ncbi:MAG: hypothetical protein KBD51_01715 [Candidatus Levybacteria bacterium]|nr:hypothetical protein [Candidatus Levybacteria bacterium]